MTDFLVKKFVKNSDDTHSAVVRAAYGNLAGIVGICCNVLLCIGKILVGTLSGSIAITADGINNLSDASSSVITLVGFKLSARPADEEHPYGHARIEYLAGLTVAIMIVVIGLELGKTSLDKILHPTPVEFNAATVIVLAASIGVKLWMMFFNRKIGRRIDSTTLAATAMDSRNDVITTTAVLVAAAAGALFQINLDGWMGLGVALFILYSGIGIIRDTLNPLLGEAPDNEMVQSIARKILSYEGVLGTHDLMVHDYGPGQRFGSVHVEMDAHEDVMKSHDIIDNIERDFLENDHLHMIIHYDPILRDDEEVGSMHAWVKSLIKQVSPQLSMHDFRMVAGPHHTNLIFDVVRPCNFALDDEALRARLAEMIHAADETCYAVITVDCSYAAIPHEE